MSVNSSLILRLSHQCNYRHVILTNLRSPTPNPVGFPAASSSPTVPFSELPDLIVFQVIALTPYSSRQSSVETGHGDNKLAPPEKTKGTTSN